MYNLTKEEEALARELYFDLGYDDFLTLETYLRSNQSNKDVKEYMPLRKGPKRVKASGGRVHRGRPANGSAEKAG